MFSRSNLLGACFINQAVWISFLKCFSGRENKNSAMSFSPSAFRVSAVANNSVYVLILCDLTKSATSEFDRRLFLKLCLKYRTSFSYLLRFGCLRLNFLCVGISLLISLDGPCCVQRLCLVYIHIYMHLYSDHDCRWNWLRCCVCWKCFVLLTPTFCFPTFLKKSCSESHHFHEVRDNMPNVLPLRQRYQN